MTSSTQDLAEILQLPVLMGMLDGGMANFTVADVDLYYQYAVKASIIFSAQLGATLLLLVIVLVATRASKRRTPMFFLNLLALFLNFLRLLLATVYFTSTFNEAYVYFTGDFALVPKIDYSNSVTDAVCAPLLLTVILVSETYQLQAVIVTSRPHHRQLLLSISAIVSLLALGFRIWLSVLNIEAIESNVADTRFDKVSYYNTISTCLAIVWFSCAFTSKLALALVGRRKLGITKFGPMEILCLVGGQTLIIPAIFSLLQFVHTGLPLMDSLTITTVVLFLPLGSLWAANAGYNDGTQPYGITVPLKYMSGGTPNLQLSPVKGLTSLAKGESSNSHSSPVSSTNTPLGQRMHSIASDLEKQGF